MGGMEIPSGAIREVGQITTGAGAIIGAVVEMDEAACKAAAKLFGEPVVLVSAAEIARQREVIAGLRALSIETLLADYQAHLSGGPISAEQEATAKRVGLAAAFGAEAYEAGMTREHGTHALIVAVLTALVDSLDPSLDYLRAHPAAGAAARAERATPASGSAA